MIEVILEFLTEYTEEAGAASGIVAVLLVLWSILKWPFFRNKTTELGKDTIEQLTAKPPEDRQKMHVADFIAMRRELKDDLQQELAEAHDGEKNVLTAKIAELESQLANPEKAFAEMQTRIAELETLLERSGNDIGGDRLAEARTALEAGDFSIADTLFAEIEERRALEVQEAARAAFGRGEIAEEEIRWADAARHYARAAKLDERYTTLRKASEFAERSGDYKGALRFSEMLVDLARREESGERLASALSEHALNNNKVGRYAEAEELYREALEIDAQTIGTRHPSYAIRFNNLALVVQAQGRYAEAEGLYREALEIDVQTIGTGHPDYAIHLNNLAGVVQAQGRYAEAEGLYREAQKIDAQTIGTSHPDYAIDLNNLAGVLVKLDRGGEARAMFEQALDIFRATLPPEHPNIAIVEKHIADLPAP